jgi:NAD(P)-dependent dehydrogenase (short-subunit alcohol dehydrogenase family)
MKNLTGKVALVTGGSRGLGVAIALELAEAGADVVITYNQSAQKAQEVVSKIEKIGQRGLAVQSDQGDTNAAPLLVKRVIQEFGKLDILVNNAGLANQGSKIDDPNADTQAWDRMWQVNVLGAISTIRAASQKMSHGGRIISIGTGLATHVGVPGVTEYAATKAAIVGYSKGAARDLGARKITVNVIQPGIMLTDMQAGIEDVPDILLNMKAIPETIEIEDVASAVSFLSGPKASKITGAVLDISGGWTA